MEEHPRVIHTHRLAPAQLLQGCLIGIGHGCVTGEQAHAASDTRQRDEPHVGGKYDMPGGYRTSTGDHLMRLPLIDT
ncbi:hypothetical protein D3C76_1581900 [compost metagenome]